MLIHIWFSWILILIQSFLNLDPDSDAEPDPIRIVAKKMVHVLNLVSIFATKFLIFIKNKLPYVLKKEIPVPLLAVM